MAIIYQYWEVFIRGSSHYLEATKGYIRIGCLHHPTKYWLENYKEIGIWYGYTEKQIEEYKNYIDFCAKHFGEEN